MNQLFKWLNITFITILYYYYYIVFYEEQSKYDWIERVHSAEL